MSKKISKKTFEKWMVKNWGVKVLEEFERISCNDEHLEDYDLSYALAYSKSYFGAAFWEHVNCEYQNAFEQLAKKKKKKKTWEDVCELLNKLSDKDEENRFYNIHFFGDSIDIGYCALYNYAGTHILNINKPISDPDGIYKELKKYLKTLKNKEA